MPLKLVVDNRIALIGQLRQYADVIALDSSSITADTIVDADAIIVRTETQINQQLLAGSRIKFVGSATIGSDHIDHQILKNNNIAFANAPGCNSRAVVEFVLASLFSLYSIAELQTKRIGIVGCGNIGSRLYQLLNKLDITLCCYDPFVEPNTLTSAQTAIASKEDYVSNMKWATFDTILDCDIISIHTPLTNSGNYPTYHLFDEQQLSRLGDNCCLINTSRGSVINNEALLKKLEQHSNFKAVLDVWENEPNINHALLDKVTIATPHIAGYSQRGKHQATAMVLEKLLDFFNIAKHPIPIASSNKRVLDVNNLSIEQAMLQHFNPMILSEQLKNNYQQASDFRQQRSSYQFRTETADIDWENLSEFNQLLR